MEDKDLIYRRLQKHLDRMPVGFPESKSGLDIRILKEFFTPEEAAVALELGMLPEDLPRIYNRLKNLDYTIDEATAILDSMYRKGLIAAGRLISSDRKKKLYSNAQFAIGFFELNVDMIKKSAAGSIIEYSSETFKDEFFKKGVPVQMRTIPIGKSIKLENFTATYDDVREIISATDDLIVLNHCVCRETNGKAGRPCKKTDLSETCIALKNTARHFIDAGRGRVITKDEVMKLLDKFEQAGLVLQPENSIDPTFICCCCGDCCGVLTMAKKFPVPAERYSSNYFASVDREACSGCGVCTERCQMEAVSVADNKAVIDRGRCIGCGLCTSICPTEAMALIRKDIVKVPPKNHIALYKNILKKKLGPLKMAKTVVKYMSGMKV